MRDRIVVEATLSAVTSPNPQSKNEKQIRVASRDNLINGQLQVEWTGNDEDF